MIFIPIDHDTIKFGSKRSRYFGEILESTRAKKKKTAFPPEIHFIIFPFHESKRQVQTIAQRFNGYSGNCYFSEEILLIDAILFHEILHALPHEKSYETAVIEKRHKSREEIFDMRILETGIIHDINSVSFWKEFLGNDEEYLTMFGLGASGLNLLNESFYLSRKYGFIRLFHRALCYEFKGVILTAEWSVRLPKMIALRYADKDLFNFYLNPKLLIKFSGFGSEKAGSSGESEK